MSDTTTPAELEIPDAAKDQAFACGCARLDCRREGYQDDALPIIVAAELRRQAEAITATVRASFTGRISSLSADEQKVYAAQWHVLSRRADELDPQP